MGSEIKLFILQILGLLLFGRLLHCQASARYSFVVIWSLESLRCSLRFSLSILGFGQSWLYCQVMRQIRQVLLLKWSCIYVHISISVFITLRYNSFYNGCFHHHLANEIPLRKSKLEWTKEMIARPQSFHSVILFSCLDVETFKSNML